MPKLTVHLYQKLTKRGIVLGEVYLFKDGGPIEAPENADYRKSPSLDGTAVFEVLGFFRVGVKVPLRFAADPVMEPIEEWKTVWSAWGAVGVARDIVVNIPLKWKLDMMAVVAWSGVAKTWKIRGEEERC